MQPAVLITCNDAIGEVKMNNACRPSTKKVATGRHKCTSDANSSTPKSPNTTTKENAWKDTNLEIINILELSVYVNMLWPY